MKIKSKNKTKRFPNQYKKTKMNLKILLEKNYFKKSKGHKRISTQLKMK